LNKAKIILLIVLLASADLYAVKRLEESMELYSKGKYTGALKKVQSYLEDNPKDEVALKMRDIIGRKLAYLHFKKGYTLIAEGLKNKADEELAKATEYHPGYSKNIERRYASYLSEFSPEQAANKILYDLLKSPAPDESAVYEISMKVRRKAAGSVSEAEWLDFEELTARVNVLSDKKQWNQAVELITEYIVNNPGSADAKVLLSDINRRAAEYFYNQAVYYLEKKKIKEGKKNVEQSRRCDPEWFSEKVDNQFEKVKMQIAVGDEKSAKRQLELLTEMVPENPKPALYLRLFNEKIEGFLKRSIEIYRNRHYAEAAARFDFLRLKEPQNVQAQLYYHLSAARNFIKEREFEKVKEHIIKALRISPGEKEALSIFERLQDVMEIMGKT